MSSDPTLDDLVHRCLELHEEQGERALEDLCAQHPEHAARLRARIEGLRKAGLIGGESSSLPERLGEFRILRRLGAGGMGIVVLAHQETLDREVALKLVRPEQLYFDGARERFQREVLTVARLQHPGIVPVYAVGEQDGLPYFAMEHVRGATLADALRWLALQPEHPTQGSELERAIAALLAEAPSAEPAPLFRGTWVETALRVLREVAEALEHAHRSGVMHRDLKPSNIMLTRGGRVLLLDFGLSSDGQTDRLTRTGKLLGSLPYMAPEQLDGQRAFDRRSDIYSLGVTLYELLTLELPFTESTAATLGARIREGRPAALRGRVAQVSWEVETVCQTAMELDPQRRYASAEELARDLSNVLEKRPILARRAGVLLLSRRWVQRHPALSVAALLLIGTPSLMLLQQFAANRALSAKSRELFDSNLKLEASLDDARLQSELAARNFERAYRAVETMLQQVGAERLRGLPHFEPVRRELLLEALRFHEELLSERSDDPALRRLYARALAQTADIHGYLQQFDEALAGLAAQRSLLVELRGDSGDSALEAELAWSEFRSAQSLRLLGRLGDAESFLRSAIDGLALLEDSPSMQGGDPLLIDQVRIELGRNLQGQGRSEESRAVLVEVVAHLRAVSVSAEADTQRRSLLGKALHALGRPGAFVPIGTAPETFLAQKVAALTESVELREELAREAAQDPGAQFDLGESLLSLALAHAGAGNLEENEDYLRQAIVPMKRLRRDFPSVPMYADALGAAQMSLASLLLQGGSGDEGARLTDAALAEYEFLCAGLPENPEYAQNLGYLHYQAGWIDEEAGDLDAAIEHAERAMSLGRELFASGRSNSMVLGFLQRAYELGARCYLQRGDHIEAANSAEGSGRLVPDRPAAVFYAASRVGMCIPLVEQDRSLDAAARAALIGEYDERAAALMRPALAVGLDEAYLERTLGDPDLDCLRSQPAFNALLAEYGLERFGDG